MRLLLAITSEEGRELGHRARCEFGEEGGSIGRNAACTWVLPDPTNVLSARHAVVAFNGRGFEIGDTSTNGVYVNTVKSPIGRGASAFLSDGDTLYLGPFEVSVRVVEDAAEERRRLGVGGAAIALRSEPPRRAEAPPMRANLTVENVLSGLVGASAPPSASPLDLAALVQSEPSAPTVSPPARGVIPADVFADLLGSVAIAKGAGQPAAGGFPAPLAAPRADPLGFLAPRAGAPLIPDAFDFSDLMKSSAPASAPVPQTRQPWPAAAPQATPPLDPAPMVAAAPPAPEPPLSRQDQLLSEPAPLPSQPQPPQLPAPQVPSAPRIAALSPSMAADLISLRPPGASAEAASPRALDPIVVLRQRAAGQSRPANGGPMPGGTVVTPSTRSGESSISLPQPSGDRSGAPAPDGAQQAHLADAFWSGLGVDAKAMPPERQAELLAECGRALREAVVGLVPTLNARSSMKDELRIDQTRLRPKENNPLKFLPSGEAVLKALVDRELEGFLPLSQALREGFSDIKAHEVATLVALDAVVKSVLARFDPGALEAQAGAPSKMFGRGPDKTRLWDQFVRLHAGLSDNLEETTRKLVGEEFARAYAHQVETFRRGGA